MSVEKSWCPSSASALDCLRFPASYLGTTGVRLKYLFVHREGSSVLCSDITLLHSFFHKINLCKQGEFEVPYFGEINFLFSTFKFYSSSSKVLMLYVSLCSMRAGCEHPGDLIGSEIWQVKIRIRFWMSLYSVRFWFGHQDLKSLQIWKLYKKVKITQ